MYVKNNWAFVVYKFVLLAVCGYGIACHMNGDWASFNYYTVLSNTACFVYFLTSLIVNIRRMAAGESVETWRPRVEGAVVFCITVTFLIYHFVLRPEAFRMGNDGNFYSALNMAQHYIVPVMTIGDWLLFCPKGKWRKGDPASWLLIPLFYFVYILIRAPFAGNIGGTSSPYPYAFIDIQANGVGVVARNALLAAVGMLALAYILYAADMLLARVGEKRKVH